VNSFASLFSPFFRQNSTKRLYLSFGETSESQQIFAMHSGQASIGRESVSPQVIGPAHNAFVFSAMMHREHMTGFVCGDLERSAKKRVITSIVIETCERPYADAVFHVCLAEHEVH
jgi:hypothetical protein